MTTTPQTEAMRLADDIDNLILWLERRHLPNVIEDVRKYQAELRRLDARVDELMHHVCVLQGMNNESLESIKALTAENDQLRAQVERLQASLKKANDQAEHFEREWYLRGDEIERLQGGEPVAWCLGNPQYADSSNVFLAHEFEPDGEYIDEWTPLYTAQPAAPAMVALTEDQIDELTVWFDPDPHGNVHCDVVATVRAVELAHGIGQPAGGEAPAP
ncbi:MAG TPA: hypothetical protein VFM33_12910 [Aquabacterium sp.]|nr:hypothetical protein [Aquabacterium sp.]